MSRHSTCDPHGGRHLRWAALVIGVGLVTWGCDSKSSTVGKLTAVKAQGDPVLLAVKDGTPYINANIADDVPTLTKSDAEARENALIRRAVQITLERGASHKPYEGKDSFRIRLFVLYDLDEYGKEKAGSTIDIATYDVPRASLDGLTVDRLAKLAGPDLKNLVRDPKVNLGNLDKFE